MRIFVALIVSVVLLGSSSVFATDLDQLRTKVKKSAPSEVDVSPPVACVCKGSGVDPMNGVAGQLFNFVSATSPTGLEAIFVTCMAPLFNAGAVGGLHFCPEWVLLPK